MIKILSVVGARPQFIKVAALHRAVSKNKALVHGILHTAQHFDYNMSAIFFEELDIPKPDFHLHVSETSLAASASRMIAGIDRILSTETPDIVIVYGDTNSTLAGAVSAKKAGLTLAHVEAGLRSYNNRMPEETNRVQTDGLSDLLFCPTINAVNNLMKEGFNKTSCKIILSGDIMLDALNYYQGKLKKAEKKKILPDNFVLCTLHRQHLMQSPEKLLEVIRALNEISKQMPIILPAHPGLKKVVNELGIGVGFDLKEPVGYLEMLSLLHHCTAVITDSGGLQKEAFFCKKPCVTIREETEWEELSVAGVNFLAGDSSAMEILFAFNKAINAKNNFEAKLYGNGDAAEIIVKALVDYKRS